MHKGTVKWYNARKGFGFLEREDGEKDVFVHATAVKTAGMNRLQEGEKISFEIEDGPKGPNAINLKKEE
ncbi:MAG: Cold shock protein CspC [Alphaproteobacteria bacterium MarineAlpha5_Bin11]|nr:cold-shock protein [Pelagibacteraceae bacterium]PPR44054.1 MAG: Cold shock protein CspC [Alphaproteobacteria bacterium MarineAlpha5_Bin11]PPR51981.1 MAG: Cold shock protein CspC [Alphaproteobacteria bacterium MarineAlpha5_Bin10]|tara:strand:+ start:374 stop:580 length:207 start_codon:yes stop_codon:yes gene_type:complete